MKTAIQLLIVALILNACFQTARSYWQFYQFKDEIHSEVLHGHETTTSALHRRVMDIGAQHGLAIEWGDVQVSRQGDETIVDVSYVRDISLVPRMYTRPWTFDASVSARRSRQLRADDLR